MLFGFYFTDFSPGVGGKDLCDLQEMGAERRKRLQQMVCYRCGDEIGGLDLEERREM